VIPDVIQPLPGQPLEYKKLVPTPRVAEPIYDNYTRFQIMLKPPEKVDLSTIKVKWSRAIETK
jgi:hypothetical protein